MFKLALGPDLHLHVVNRGKVPLDLSLSLSSELVTMLHGANIGCNLSVNQGGLCTTNIGLRVWRWGRTVKAWHLVTWALGYCPLERMIVASGVNCSQESMLL